LYRNLVKVRAVSTLVGILLILASMPGSAMASLQDQSGPLQPQVSAAVHQDVSKPLSDMVAAAAKAPATPAATGQRVIPLRRIPLPSPAGLATKPDPAIQSTAGPLVATTAVRTFAGLGSGDYGFVIGFAPPDTEGAVGLTQYVQWVNASFAIFPKAPSTLVPIIGPFAGNVLWSGFGGGCQTNNDGDPIVKYDQLANRWVFTQFSVSTQPFLQCVAISTTPDATGPYYRYAFGYGTSFNDYPKLGIWPDGYYISFNMFNATGTVFLGAQACAYNRARMLLGLSATQVCFPSPLNATIFNLLPSDLDGTTLPPAGAANYFLKFGTNTLNLFKFHVNWDEPANSSFTGPFNLAVAAFTPACGGGGTCIPQPGTTQQLDSLADRLMYRLSYRNFGTYESWMVNHSVVAGASVGVRWYELRRTLPYASPAPLPNVQQQSTFAPDASYRWMGSIAQDKQGNQALGYSVSSSTVFPSVRYSGRVYNGGANTLQAESILATGTGSQLPTLSRWGDYSSMGIDPVDDCTFWYTQEYLLSPNGTFNWHTVIGAFKFPLCK
jgi:hypothetical protein